MIQELFASALGVILPVLKRNPTLAADTIALIKLAANGQSTSRAAQKLAIRAALEADLRSQVGKKRK